MPPRELVRMALPHLHADTRSMFVDAHEFNANPNALYWRVGAHGLLARCFQFHPIMVDPLCGEYMPTETLDAGYVAQACPDMTRVHVVTDSDEFVVFELTEATRGFQSLRGADVARQQAISVAACCDDFEIEYWRRYPVRIHSNELDDEWMPVTAAAEAFVRATARRARPFGMQSSFWYRCLRRTQNLHDRFWRR